MKTRLKKYGTLAPQWRQPGRPWRAGWVEVGGQRFYARSTWESNYARLLQFKLEHKMISAWKHEPKTFWFDGIKRGVCSYLPDFLVVTNDGKEEYHEVKGWMDSKSKTKIKRMAKYHPSVKLVLIDSSKYRQISRTAKMVVKEWL